MVDPGGNVEIDNTNRGEIEFSFCATSYNNVNRVRGSIDSILRAASGLNYEVVIVDNLSTDGTYEVLQDFTSSTNRITVQRERCSRGRGRQRAYRASSGRYVVCFDTDCYYRRSLRRVLDGHATWAHRSEKSLVGWGGQIHPRNLIERIGGWRDLNRAEDVDLLARLFLLNAAVSLPIQLKVEEEVRTPSGFLLPIDYFRELRYGSPFAISRLLRNKADMVAGSGYDLSKVMSTYRRLYSASLHKTLAVSFYHLAFLAINALRRRERVIAHPSLSNYLFVARKCIEEAVNPLDFGLKPEDVVCYSPQQPIIKYLAGFDPEILRKVRKINSWRRSASKKPPQDD